MTRNRYWVWFVTLVVAFTIPSAAGALPSQVRLAQGATVVLNEVQYDPSPSGSESGYEWVELLNTGSSAVSLEGWRIADNRSSDDIPDLALDAGAYVVLAAGDGFAELFPEFDGHVVTLGGSIGNSLGNSGDRVLLLAPDDTVVDAMSYGDDVDVLDPPAPDVGAGHSLERVPAGTDTDTAADWIDQPSPSPGGGAAMERPTDPPSAMPPATVAPGAAVVLNEYLPAPREVDWDGDGQANADDEWIELYSSGRVELNLRGWLIDDLADGGSDPYVIADDTVLAPGGYLLLFKRDTGVSLNNGGDFVRLLRPDGSTADETEYKSSDPDASLARLGDGSGPWTDTLPPSPGRSNPAGGDPGATQNPGPTASPTTSGPTVPPTQPSARPTDPSRQPPTEDPASTPSASGTAVTPTPQTPGAGTPTSAPDAPLPVHLPYLVTEVMFDPLLAGNDARGEWIEIHNPSDLPGSLAGWSVGDRAGWDRIPDVTVPPRGFVTIVGSRSAFAANPPSIVVVVADGAIGNGLSNGGDVVRLRGPTGELADEVSYGRNLDAFDPAVPVGEPGSSIERIPPDLDTDTADDWWIQPAPSPGFAGARHEGPPRVALNEVLPAPSRTDWDGNGVADHTDEWFELHNLSGYAVDLGGWRVVRGEDEWDYQLPPSMSVPVDGFVAVYRHESGLSLANSGDALTLVRPDGVSADRVSWDHSPGYDRSLSRAPDGVGEWTNGYPPSPGASNQPPRPQARELSDMPRPTDAARATQLGAVRALGSGTRVSVSGRVTAPPGVFGPREAYIGDESGGLRVYLSERGGRLPDLVEGDEVIATGVLKDYHGERQVVVKTAADLWLRSPGEVVRPIDVGTGVDGESVEGRLVRVTGRVVDWRGASFHLDDGSGPAKVTVRKPTGARRPWLERGQWWSVVGVVGQYAYDAPWEDGHRVTPRYARDMSEVGPLAELLLPQGLPQTGRAERRPENQPEQRAAHLAEHGALHGAENGTEHRAENGAEP